VLHHAIERGGLLLLKKAPPATIASTTTAKAGAMAILTTMDRSAYLKDFELTRIPRHTIAEALELRLQR
jgi:hypothetical protein